MHKYPLPHEIHKCVLCEIQMIDGDDNLSNWRCRPYYSLCDVQLEMDYKPSEVKSVNLYEYSSLQLLMSSWKLQFRELQILWYWWV